MLRIQWSRVGVGGSGQLGRVLSLYSFFHAVGLTGLQYSEGFPLPALPRARDAQTRV